MSYCCILESFTCNKHTLSLLIESVLYSATCWPIMSLHATPASHKGSCYERKARGGYFRMGQRKVMQSVVQTHPWAVVHTIHQPSLCAECVYTWSGGEHPTLMNTSVPIDWSNGNRSCRERWSKWRPGVSENLLMMSLAKECLSEAEQIITFKRLGRYL